MRIDDPGRSWPLLTLDRAALEHNVATVAGVVAAAGAEHAPHVKTHMSPALFARQLAAGAWGATVATPAQLRIVLGWELPGWRGERAPGDEPTAGRHAFLANELVDPRDVAWLRDALDRGDADEVWLYVDSAYGVDLLRAAFSRAHQPEKLGVLVELGVPGGRTGVRTVPDVVALARAVTDSGLRLAGVAGYEGPVAAGTSEAELAAVAHWCRGLREAGEAVADLVDGPLVLSAGGSAFADVVLRELTAAEGARVVLRSGAYVTHDHGHYLHADPWTRLGAEPLRPAIRVWASVLSTPEPGLAICGMGRRDVSFDIDLPIPLAARGVDGDGRLGPARELSGATVTALNDQHAFVTVPPEAGVAPGEVLGFGISHPCTTLDKYRTGVVTDGDVVVEQVTFEL